MPASLTTLARPAVVALLFAGCAKAPSPKPPSIGGTAWSLERAVYLSPTVPPKTIQTKQATGDSAMEIRLVVDSHTTPRLKATAVVIQAGGRKTESRDVTGTESPDGLITLTVPSLSGTSRDSVTLSGRIVAGHLVLLGDRSERMHFLDSIVFTPIAAGSTPSGVVVVQRGDSELAVSRAALEQRLKMFLRQLLVSQEAYFADYAKYADSMSKLQRMIVASDEAVVTLGLTKDGWSGAVRDKSGLTCHVFMGSTPPMAETRRMGVPWCD